MQFIQNFIDVVDDLSSIQYVITIIIHRIKMTRFVISSQNIFEMDDKLWCNEISNSAHQSKHRFFFPSLGAQKIPLWHSKLSILVVVRVCVFFFFSLFVSKAAATKWRRKKKSIAYAPLDLYYSLRLFR